VEIEILKIIEIGIKIDREKGIKKWKDRESEVEIYWRYKIEIEG
jgi:hypothetical protein